MIDHLQALIRTLEPAACAMLGSPVYIVAASRLPEPWQSAGRRTLGVSGNALDLVLRPYLRWTGRGPAILVGDEAIGEYLAAVARSRPGLNQERALRSEIAGVVAHEIGHLADQQWAFDDLPDAAAEFVAAASESWAAADHPAAVKTPIPWLDHGGPWLRLAMHAAYRLMQPLGLHAAPSIETQAYGLASPWKYAAALGDEPERLADLPLPDVAATPAPEAFTRLWQADLRRWFAALPDPTEAQVTALVQGLNLYPVAKEIDVISELVNRIRSRRETARERIVSLARAAAAGQEPDVGELDAALRDAGMDPEQFADLARRCAERRRLADVAAQEPELRRRLADLQKQIQKADDKLQKAQKLRDATALPLEAESESIVAELAQCTEARNRLPRVIIDEEAAREHEKIMDRREQLRTSIANLQTDASVARHAAAGLEREARHPLDSRAARKAADAAGLRKRAEYLDTQAAELQQQFDALTVELEPLQKRLAVV